ncbi:hypothetical protein GOP47_0022362 [Adiantum capillus-veneris]|uniref:Uncharacterized protein n=1 Tax=Adiantum capillus-veneris TaxID=13818 RepID=A0A9D4Z467_ADICA|nr:hypothetical protein GOP47_0022362 [Adiantum capillus-veneris]
MRLVAVLIRSQLRKIPLLWMKQRARAAKERGSPSLHFPKAILRTCLMSRKFTRKHVTFPTSYRLWIKRTYLFSSPVSITIKHANPSQIEEAILLEDVSPDSILGQAQKIAASDPKLERHAHSVAEAIPS